MVVGQQWNRRDKECRQIAGHFDGHCNAAVRCYPHRHMEHIQGYTGSHWMMPSGKCLRCIAPVATMVIKIGGKHKKNTNKTHLLASNCGINQSLVVYENFIPQNGSSTQLFYATNCVKMWDAMIGIEEIADISSYQTLPADKNQKSY